MNPRDFCREPGYDKAVLLSYEFDAVFFERIILRDLLAGDANDIQVVADLSRIHESQQRWIRQVHSLGKRYRLSTATLAGAFHPKLILRAKSDQAMIWVGSGNVTYSGWQSNLEVGAAWRVGKDSLDDGAWLRGVLQQLDRWLPAEAAGTTLKRILESPLLTQYSKASSPAPVLISQEGVSLASQLSTRWTDRKFDAVTITTGSTDREGAFLRQMHSQFGVSRATVLLNPETAAFDREKLKQLPLKVELLKPANNQKVHAKCYWFTGPAGSAAIVGSANCSSAAWLLPPSRGGNVEAVVVYDDAPVEAYAWFLGRFTAEKAVPVELDSLTAPDDAVPTQNGTLQIAEVRWEGLYNELSILFVTAIPETALVTILLAGVEYDCHSSELGRTWTAHPDAAVMKAKHTQYGKVTVLTEVQESIHTVWINDLSELREFIEGSRFTKPFAGLGSARSTSEQQQIVNALQSLARQILSEGPAYAGGGGWGSHVRSTTTTAAGESDPPATDPHTLIRSLSEIMASPKGPGLYSLSGVSLMGIMRVFFGEDEPQADLTPIEEPSTEPGENDPPPPPPPPAPVPLTGSSKKKLKDQLNSFLDQLSGTSFAEKCNVEQLVQAAAFPLGVVIYGLAGEWLDATEAQEMVRKVFDILFCRKYSSGVGLVATVRSRSRDANELEQFRHTAGDGRLWTVLLAVLSKLDWTDAHASLKKALSLRAILRHNDLRSTATPARLSSLLRLLGSRFDPGTILQEGAAADERLRALEQYVTSEWNMLLGEQETLPLRVRQGDVHFSKTAGWIFTVAQPPDTAKNGFRVYRQDQGEEIDVWPNFYVNLSLMSETNEMLFALLTDACSLTKAQVDGEEHGYPTL